MTPSAQHGEPLTINGCLSRDGLLYWRFGLGHEEMNLPDAERARDSYNALRSVANPAALPGLIEALTMPMRSDETWNEYLHRKHSATFESLVELGVLTETGRRVTPMPYDEAIKTYSDENVARVEAESKLFVKEERQAANGQE